MRVLPMSCEQNLSAHLPSRDKPQTQNSARQRNHSIPLHPLFNTTRTSFSGCKAVTMYHVTELEPVYRVYRPYIEVNSLQATPDAQMISQLVAFVQPTLTLETVGSTAAKLSCMIRMKVFQSKETAQTIVPNMDWKAVSKPYDPLQYKLNYHVVYTDRTKNSWTKGIYLLSIGKRR